MQYLTKAGVICFLLFLFNAGVAGAQSLVPGFDADEYLEALALTAEQGNIGEHVPQEHVYSLVYRSPEVGLHNRWELWVNNTTMVISLRGTIATTDSWLENLYSAMIPATGELHLSDSVTFKYKFAADPKAMVHVGWAVGIGSLMPTIIQQVNKYHALGIRQVIIIGHSQGGALAYLLRSYLYYQVQDNNLPRDLVIKTYCSAAPKPGNLYYAYDYDFINRGNWSLTVVNAADWVPETPFTVQNLNDINKLNPFTNAKVILRQQRLPLRLYGNFVYARLSKPARKDQRRFTKYLGHVAYTRVKKYMPQYKQPTYTNSVNYMRAGTPVVLEPDADYYKLFPDTSSNIFEHHLFKPYSYLVRKIYKK